MGLRRKNLICICLMITVIFAAWNVLGISAGAYVSADDTLNPQSSDTVSEKESHVPVVIVTPSQEENKVPVLVVPSADEEETSDTVSKGNSVYAAEVIKALGIMKVTPEHLALWADKNKHTHLNCLRECSKEQQFKIAAIACYIHKSNRRLPAETVWREACAMYFYGTKYGVAPELLAAFGKNESNFVPTVVGRGGVYGIMQVMYRVHKAKLAKRGIAASKEQLFIPENGIHAGAYVFKCAKGSGSVYKGVMRYVGGHSDRYYMKLQNNMTKIRQCGEALRK